MAFTQNDLERMGLVCGTDGVWSKPVTGKKSELPKDFVRVTGMKKGRPAASELPTIDYLEQGEGWCRIIFAGVIHGLNGSKGLMQQHWAMARKEKEKFTARVKSLNPPQITGQVRLTMIRHTVRFMDIDNLCSTIKLPLDAIRNNKVIQDDGPEIIAEFIPRQVKCRRKDQRTEILIEKK